MPGKLRVHELAKKLGVTSKELLATLKEQGEFVKTASSTVEPPVVKKMEQYYAPKNEGADDAQNAAPAGNASAPQTSAATGAATQAGTPKPAAPAAKPGPGASASGAPKPGAKPGSAKPSAPKPGRLPAPRNPVRVTLLVAPRSLVRPHSALVELVPVMAPQPPRKAALCRAPWPSQDRSLALVRRG